MSAEKQEIIEEDVIEDEEIIEEDVIEDEEIIEGDDAEEGEKSIEDRALGMGWVPKEEYKGDPEHWKTAEKYVEDADNNYKDMRKNNRYLEKKLDKMQKSQDAIIAHHNREIKAREEEAFRRGREEADSRIRQAVEDGDIEAANQALSDRDSLQKAAQEEAFMTEWRKNNEWFDTNPAMRRAAIEYCDLNAGLSPEDQLSGATAYVREEFPRKFGSPRKKAPVAVNGRGNNVTKAPPAPGTYEALTQEARNECDHSVKSGIPQELFLKYATKDMFK